MESPPESLSESPPDAPREPVLTLPAALTAYVVLLAAIHLRQQDPYAVMAVLVAEHAVIGEVTAFNLVIMQKRQEFSTLCARFQPIISFGWGMGP